MDGLSHRSLALREVIDMIVVQLQRLLVPSAKCKLTWTFSGRLDICTLVISRTYGNFETVLRMHSECGADGPIVDSLWSWYRGPEASMSVMSVGSVRVGF